MLEHFVCKGEGREKFGASWAEAVHSQIRFAPVEDTSRQNDRLGELSAPC